MPSPYPCSPVIRECWWSKTQIEKKIMEHIHDNLTVPSKKSKMVYLASSVIKNIAVLLAWSRFQVKLISCFGFGSESSAGCLLKVCVW